MTSRTDRVAEARRLRALADQAADRLATLEARREAALEGGCGPCPLPSDIDAARSCVETREAEADAASRIAAKGAVA